MITYRRQPRVGLTWLYSHGYIAYMHTMPAGKFKDRCLEVLDRVAETRVPVVITKRGRPVATLVPCAPVRRTSDSLTGSILKERGNPYGTSEAWDADLP